MARKRPPRRCVCARAASASEPEAVVDDTVAAPQKGANVKGGHVEELCAQPWLPPPVRPFVFFWVVLDPRDVFESTGTVRLGGATFERARAARGPSRKGTNPRIGMTFRCTPPWAVSVQTCAGLRVVDGDGAREVRGLPHLATWLSWGKLLRVGILTGESAEVPFSTSSSPLSSLVDLSRRHASSRRMSHGSSRVSKLFLHRWLFSTAE